MNRSILPASLCAALLLATSAVVYASPDTTTGAPDASPTATPPAAGTEPPPPKPGPQVEELLKTMSKSDTWGHPDLFGEFTGMKHLFAGDYGNALKYFKLGARYADKLSQASIGMMYLNGRGVSKDLVKACAWVMLAAERDYPVFVSARERVCGTLSQSQLDSATTMLDTQLLPEYGDKVAKPRMALELRQARSQMTGSRVGFDFGVTAAQSSIKSGIGTQGRANFYKEYWSPQYWDPKKYFALRDRFWRGTVTVGNPEPTHAPAAAGVSTGKPADTLPSPAPAASSPGSSD